jgi:ubiquinone/menaquinone biosynthesis C-methylase UbiE
MHETARNNAQQFFDKYCQHSINTKIVLDIGSLDINGSLYEIFQGAKQYIGLDQNDGKNVTMIGNSHEIPLEDKSVDIIVCSSCFEHDDMFWVSFLEMCRTIKSGGYIYIQAPSNGPYHAHPVDNWRFYKDAWSALEKWGKVNNYNIKLVESYVSTTPDPYGKWLDNIGIYYNE